MTIHVQSMIVLLGRDESSLLGRNKIIIFRSESWA